MRRAGGPGECAVGGSAHAGRDGGASRPRVLTRRGGFFPPPLFRLPVFVVGIDGGSSSSSHLVCRFLLHPTKMAGAADKGFLKQIEKEPVKLKKTDTKEKTWHPTAADLKEDKTAK